IGDLDADLGARRRSGSARRALQPRGGLRKERPALAGGCDRTGSSRPAPLRRSPARGGPAPHRIAALIQILGLQLTTRLDLHVSSHAGQEAHRPIKSTFESHFCNSFGKCKLGVPIANSDRNRPQFTFVWVPVYTLLEA